MTTRVLFDLSAFSHLVSNNDFPISFLNTQDRTRTRAYGSFTFLEELVSLRRSDPNLFHKIREHYVDVTFPRLILPWNELVLKEVREGRPIARNEALLSESDYLTIINHLSEDNIDVLVAHEVKRRKQKYEAEMNEAHSKMMDDPLLHDRSETRHAFREWFENAEHFLQSRGERIFQRRDIEYGRLPHVRTFLYYFFTKLYQATVDRRRHQRGDGYDRAYVVESVTLGHLVTDDKNMMRTAKQIKNSDIVVYNLDEFIASAKRSLNDETRAIRYSPSQIEDAREQ